MLQTDNCTARTLYSPVVTICTAQWSLYVPYSGHHMYRTVVTICTVQWSLYVPYSGHYMYHTVVTICTTSLTFNNSTFCPTQLYLCVLCGSQNKQPLFPYTTLTDWFFVTETVSVYCAVRTECLNNPDYIRHESVSLYALIFTVYEKKDTKLIPRCRNQSIYFLYSTLTSDGIWAHHNDPELRSRSLEYCLSLSSRQKKIPRLKPFAGKCLLAVVWDSNNNNTWSNVRQSAAD